MYRWDGEHIGYGTALIGTFHGHIHSFKNIIQYQLVILITGVIKHLLCESLQLFRNAENNMKFML